MIGMKRSVIALVLILAAVTAVVGQEFSERKEIAIFQLSYYGQPAPPQEPSITVEAKGKGGGSVTIELRGTGNEQYDQLFQRAFGAVDEEIRSVFINLGRFDVTGMTQRLTYDDVNDFIAALQEYKEAGAEMPEAVLLGQQAFTEADFRELVGGFIVVVPSVSWYDLARQDDGDYEATIETSFTFINVDDLSTLGQFFVETTGFDETPQEAVRDAVDGIATQLTFEIRSMEVFQLKTGIIDIAGREVTLEFGQNMGIRVGDEYAIVRSRTTGTGHQTTDETGLVVVKEVREGFSLATLLYSSPKPVVGDQLREVPRLGFDTSVYANVIQGETDNTFVAGIKGAASRGFYRWRPVVGLEIPFTGSILSLFFPANIYAGAETNWYLGRIKVHPSFGVGVGGAVPTFEDETDQYDEFYMTHFGGQVKFTTSYLINRDVMLFFDLGYAYWVGLLEDEFGSTSGGFVSNTFFDGYGGILFGAGITFK